MVSPRYLSAFNREGSLGNQAKLTFWDFNILAARSTRRKAYKGKNWTQMAHGTGFHRMKNR
jgi:hypothetical protein